MSITTEAVSAENNANVFFERGLADADPDIFASVTQELGRQQNQVELIASENIVSRAVIEAMGSVLTNKYAEGYPGKRYYGGCEFVDIAENLAIERVTKLFNCKYANVQPNSGSQANQGVFQALLSPGDTILGMSLAAGGHLTHGAKPNQSGKEVVRDEMINEAAYSEFIKEYKDTYFKEVFDVLSSKYKLGRVRILLKQPRSTLSWHRDPEPRLHIPIITNPGSIMVIDNIAKHLPADGSVWITNNTKYHNAFNGGEENRIHLVACVLNHKFN